MHEEYTVMAPRGWKPHAILLITLLCLAACDGGQTQVRQMKTAVIESEVELLIVDTWTAIGPPILINTTEQGTLTALYVAESAGGVGFVGIGGSLQLPIEIPVEVRIKFDDQVGLPSSANFTGSPASVVGHTPDLESHSFLAFRQNVPAGGHTVIVEWRSSEPGARMGSRTLTVWEVVLTDTSG